MRLMIMTLLSVLMTCMVFAGEEKEQKQETAQASSAQANMVQTLDEARGPNGELPSELRDALENMVDRSTEGLVEEKLPNGGYSVDLKGRFMSAMVVTVDENDQVNAECFAPDDARINHEGHDHKPKKSE